MITDIDMLYNRHLLSLHQIKTHFGPVDDTHVFHTTEIFQTAEFFFQVVEALQSEEVDFIPLKGPVLSHLLYQDCSSRRFYDLDFLVDFGSMERCSRLLDNLGYHSVWEWPTTRAEKKRLRQSMHHLPFQHPKERTDVEIHWRLFARYKFPDMDFAKLYKEHTVPYTLDGYSFRKLSNELELLFLLIHGAKHAWFRIKWLVDVNDYIKNVAVDFDALRDLAAQNGFLNRIDYYNTMAETYIPDACTIPGKRRAIPNYLKRYANNEIRKPQKDSRIPVKKSIGTLAKTCRTEFYLATNFYCKYRAVKIFFSGALPKKLVRLLRPIVRFLDNAMKNEVV